MSFISCYAAESGLDAFQNFVNGKIPIKEATMSRKVFKADGKLMNEEWWRFGYQDGTWFVQRLMPATNDPSKLIPRENNHVCGASFSDVWVVSDENLHLVRKDMVAGSVPDNYGVFYRSLMFSAVSLGLPRKAGIRTFEDSAIQWDGLKFTSAANKYSTNGSLVSVVPRSGVLKLGDNGLPVSCDLPPTENFRGATVTYKYATTNSGIPSGFIYKNSNLQESCYEFLSLQLGSNDLSDTGGYVPSQFSTKNARRETTVWLEDKSYYLNNGKLKPSFESPSVELGEPAPALHGIAWFNVTNSLMMSELRGKVILLDFWATFCPPCVKALPETQAVFERYKDQGLAVIGVNLDTEKEKIEAFVKSHKITFPVMMDEVFKPEDPGYDAFPTTFVKDHKPLYPVEDESFVTADSYGPEGGIPEYILVDKLGILVWKSHDGEMPADSQIQQLLKSNN
jgi:thiol-disulfide isomerase/thioredoxin